MADFSALIAQIEAYVKQNGNNEITGNGLQEILVGMVNALGTVAITALQGDLADEVTARTNADGAINAKIPAEASSSNKLADKEFVTGLTTPLQNALNAINANIENGYVYAGIATPAGTPASGKVFYLATQAGTYTNFGELVVTLGINILKFDGTNWSQEQLIGIDDEPDPESDNLFSSKGAADTHGYYIENQEYLKVETDSEDRVLHGIRKDGTVYVSGNLEVKGKVINRDIDKKISNLDEDALSCITLYSKPSEYEEVKTDSEGRILCGRKEDGTYVENCRSEINEARIGSLELGEQGQKYVIGLNTDSGDILDLHPRKVILPILGTFKRRTSAVGYPDNYYLNYRYVNFTMLWFSDMHHIDRRLERISKFYEEYKDYIDEVLCSGDATDYFEQPFNGQGDFWMKYGKSFLNVIGNHECALIEDKKNEREDDKIIPAWRVPAVSQKECYDKYYKDFLSYTGMIFPDADHSYWYKDCVLPARDNTGGIVPNQYAYKIRIIGIDCLHWKEQVQYSDGTYMGVYPDGQPRDNGEQLTWLTNILADANDNGFSVICVVHNPVGKDNFNSENTPFQCLDPYYFDNGGDSNNIDQKAGMLDAVQGFINGGGKFITWLTGHTHDDRFGTIKDYPDQLMITIDTAGNYEHAKGTKFEFNTMHTSPENTVNDDLFNIVSINVFGGTISLYRVGCNYDKHGRHIDSIAYDYINKRIL